MQPWFALHNTRQFLLSRGGKDTGKNVVKICVVYIYISLSLCIPIRMRPYSHFYRYTVQKQIIVDCVDCGGLSAICFGRARHTIYRLARWFFASETTNDDQTDDKKTYFCRGDIKYTEVVMSVQFSSPDCPDKIHNTYRRNV